MSLAATIASESVAETISSTTDTGGVFMHGPTFMANPLACAVANASIELLTGSPWQANIVAIEHGLTKGLAPCAALPGVHDVRTLGAIGVVEMKASVNVAVLQQKFVDEGVWVRPFGKLVYVMPPYVISSSELDFLTSAIAKVLRDN